ISDQFRLWFRIWPLALAPGVSQDSSMTCPLCGDVCGCVPAARPLAISGSHARVERIEDVTERRDESPIDKAPADDPFAASWDSSAESTRPQFVVDRVGERMGKLDRVGESGFDDGIRSDATSVLARKAEALSLGVGKEFQ